jgi:hypothetical protein
VYQSNYEFAKYCWKVLVQPEFHRASPRNELENEVTSWLLDSTGSKCTAHDSFVDLLLKHVKIASGDKNDVSSKINLVEVQYALSLDIVVDSVTLSFGNVHTSNLIEIDLSHISLKSSALLSDSGWFTPGAEDRNKVSFCSITSASYLNTKHGYMECAIQSYPCYGSATYQVTLPDASESTDSELNCEFIPLGTSNKVNPHSLPLCFSTSIFVFGLFGLPTLSQY